MEFKVIKQLIISATGAGIAISIGCIAYLATGYAWLFPIGLFIVCYYQLHLYTGKICWAKPTDCLMLLITYICNTISAYVLGIIIAYAKPGLIEQAQTMVTNKLNEGIAIIPLAILCNIMIFIAVDNWKDCLRQDTARFIGLAFPTMIFVYCGFEHCIANAFYFGLGRGACTISQTVSFLLINAFWNSIGGITARKIKYIK